MMDKRTFERCFVARCQGLVAAMLLHRGTQPSDEEIAMLGDPDFTMREMAELAATCDLRLDFQLSPRTAQGDDDGRAAAKGETP